MTFQSLQRHARTNERCSVLLRETASEPQRQEGEDGGGEMKH